MSTQELGSRTRPASYGRASSWSESPSTRNTEPSINKMKTFGEDTLPTLPVNPSGATVSTWSVVNPSSGSKVLSMLAMN